MQLRECEHISRNKAAAAVVSLTRGQNAERAGIRDKRSVHYATGNRLAINCKARYHKAINNMATNYLLQVLSYLHLVLLNWDLKLWR